MTTFENLTVCKPKTDDHRRGMRWLSSLVRHSDGGDTSKGVADDKRLIDHSLQFYQIYAQTDDPRYLAMSEEFLRDALKKS